jgi:hypothetical protein
VTDLIFLAVLVAFFALAVGLVRACDRIIGPDTAAAPDVAAEADAGQVAA